MWLKVEWYDDEDALVGVYGEYGPLSDSNGQPVVVTNPANGQPVQVQSILDLSGQHTKIYEAHYGVTQEWAAQLMSLGYPAEMIIGFDRLTGAVAHTLGELAAEPAGTTHESFHFVLNNKVLTDNRIPTWGMRYDDSRVRNTLPVPSTQYGAPEAGGVYQHWDDANVPGKRMCNFKADKVIGIVQASPALLISGVQPARANDCNKRAT